jgi:hypothetical protein
MLKWAGLALLILCSTQLPREAHKFSKTIMAEPGRGQVAGHEQLEVVEALSLEELEQRVEAGRGQQVGVLISHSHP